MLRQHRVALLCISLLSMGIKDVVELLISKGANVNAVNEAGMRPLMFARGSGNKDVVEILIKNGAQ